MLRAPALAETLAAGVQRLPAGSPVRRRLLNFQVRRFFAAMARSDVDVVLQAYEPDAEVWMRSMAGVGMDDCYHGHAGVRKLYQDVDDVFREWWWTIREVVDGGSRVAVRADFVGYGRASGVKTTVVDGGTAVRLSPRGRATWQEWFAETGGWPKALAALGLDG